MQPIQLWRYLGFRRTKNAPDIKHLFYLSWEDAFWDILKNKKVSKGSNILIPELFCVDVENNVSKRGYRVVHYPVSKYLVSEEKLLIDKVTKFNPSVVVVFHIAGIHNQLFNKQEWVKNLNSETILIEDSVHQMVNPEKVRIIRKNHFVIDSLRKVIPLQGSNLFGTTSDLDFSEPSFFQSFPYSFKVTMLWLKMLFFWNLADIFTSRKVSAHFAEKAEKLMIKGYNVIGDSEKSAKGFSIFNLLQQFIDFEKIGKIKEQQVEFYEKKLGNIVTTKIRYSIRDKAEMRGWPIILPSGRAKKVISFLRDNGLMMRFELDDSIWSKKRKIVYLPLGPHLDRRKLLSVCSLVIKSMEQNV